ncbi:MAG: hypothetical protein ACOC7V_11380 [Spirochaetota bacterium]
MTIHDNGTGVDPVHFEQPQGVGLLIVQTLVDQLDGSLRAEAAAGTMVEIVFRPKK